MGILTMNVPMLEPMLRCEVAALDLLDRATTQYRFFAPDGGYFTPIGIEVTVTFVCGTQSNVILIDVDTVHHTMTIVAGHDDSAVVTLDLNDIVDVREAESQQIALGLLI